MKQWNQSERYDDHTIPSSIVIGVQWKYSVFLYLFCQVWLQWNLVIIMCFMFQRELLLENRNIGERKKREKMENGRKLSNEVLCIHENDSF